MEVNLFGWLLWLPSKECDTDADFFALKVEVEGVGVELVLDFVSELPSKLLIDLAAFEVAFEVDFDFESNFVFDLVRGVPEELVSLLLVGVIGVDGFEFEFEFAVDVDAVEAEDKDPFVFDFALRSS